MLPSCQSKATTNHTMTWSEVGSVEMKGTTEGFHDAVEIWRKKPHVANRRLCGAQLLWSEAVLPLDGIILDDCINQLLLTCTTLHSDAKDGKDADGCQRLIRETIENISSVAADVAGSRWTVTVRLLIPKQEKKMQKVIEVVLIDKSGLEGVFLPFCAFDGESNSLTKANDFAYKISFDQGNKKLLLHLHNDWNSGLDMAGGSYSTTWLTSVLLAKLARWSEETKLNTEVTSLRLVGVERYGQVYNDLKNKYGKHFVEIWPEATDPSKFVYEDIGIAAYLLVLWEMERDAKGLKTRQSFVDMGCGNGLLVYLLTAEGHPGVGLDIRKRKIWDLLSDVADLKECAIKPSDESLFPNHDWLIGNHSDELTPWIPVIAARSHYNCRYFVLPCCPWDFGNKFSSNSKGQNTSQYQGYLEFVQDVGQVCGFTVKRDTLRIPSTKRVCFIGMERSYLSTDEASVDQRIKEYIRERSQRGSAKRPRLDAETKDDVHSDDHVNASSEVLLHTKALKNSLTTSDEPQADDRVHDSSDSSCDDLALGKSKAGESCNIENNVSTADASDSNQDKSVWLATFEPRSSVEKPKNAVCVEQSVKDLIAITVMKSILQTTDVVTCSNGQSWNKGGVLPLSETSQLFTREILLRLKNECGGLQTLLKNCPDVFLVRGGNVGLRDWTSDDYLEYRASRNKKRPNSNTKAEEKRKSKQCFFFENHPDGCPLDGENCRFAHGKDDLKTYL